VSQRQTVVVQHQIISINQCIYLSICYLTNTLPIHMLPTSCIVSTKPQSHYASATESSEPRTSVQCHIRAHVIYLQASFISIRGRELDLEEYSICVHRMHMPACKCKSFSHFSSLHIVRVSFMVLGSSHHNLYERGYSSSRVGVEIWKMQMQRDSFMVLVAPVRELDRWRGRERRLRQDYSAMQQRGGGRDTAWTRRYTLQEGSKKVRSGSITCCPVHSFQSILFYSLHNIKFV